MNSKNDGGAAFPRPFSQHVDVYPPDALAQSGMSLRDYFAGQALRAMIELYKETGSEGNTRETAKWSYRIADLMIVERDK